MPDGTPRRDQGGGVEYLAPGARYPSTTLRRTSLHTVIALITGASSGIGEATARRLAREPGEVGLVLVARREDRLRALADELAPPAPDLHVTIIAADITDPDAPARIAAQVEHEHGRLDLLVNNAGAAWRASFAKGGWENVRRHMELNFDAQVRVTEALLALLRGSAPSAIVNVASTAGRVGRGGTGAYSGEQVRVRRLDGLAAPRGGAPRRARRPRPARVRRDGGLSAEAARRGLAHALDRLDARRRSPRRSSTPVPAAAPSATSRACTGSARWRGSSLPALTRRVLRGGKLTPATKPNAEARPAAGDQSP